MQKNRFRFLSFLSVAALAVTLLFSSVPALSASAFAAHTSPDDWCTVVGGSQQMAVPDGSCI